MPPFFGVFDKAKKANRSIGTGKWKWEGYSPTSMSYAEAQDYFGVCFSVE